MADRRKPFDDAELAADTGGKRLCAATREALDPACLIRFVADPGGVIVPDLARRLPGRGVWVKAEKSVVAQAVRANVFARSLKRAVKADPALPEQVERLIEKRVLEALALANKAGLVTAGFQQVDALIETGAAVVLVQAADAAESGREKLARKFAAVARARGREQALVTSLSTEQLSLAMGRSNVVHAALIHGGAAERFMLEAERLDRYRSGSAASGGTPNGPESAQDLEV
ncbi:RNA-binding protein [Hyphomicrobium sp.]|uniref:RNA-binding protein n=1 Tax=Hyphomicrobium sp. TaxID=82 RepID=UPI0025BD9E10|nr:RNA-binding protein [Hyphomicrobium sp.]MCC7252252.1 RNA-binding protein [Hyphomicrobium sp.]